MKFKPSAWKGKADPDETYWMDGGETNTYFLNVIRIFYVAGTPAMEEIGKLHKIQLTIRDRIKSVKSDKKITN